MNVMPSNADPGLPLQPAEKLSRRDFLIIAEKIFLAASGLFGLGWLVRYLSFQPDPAPPTQFDLGPAQQYPSGSRTLIGTAHAVLLHTDSGFLAFSLICPHLGCTLEITQDAYSCPCHGSKFDQSGELINGPANKPLRQLRVEATPDGRLILLMD